MSRPPLPPFIPLMLLGEGGPFCAPIGGPFWTPIDNFLGGGAEGHAAMADWLRGGFEMDRKGNWRLKPQVADTIQRDVQAVMAQTGWERAITRSAEHSASFSTNIGGNIGGSVSQGSASATDRQKQSGSGAGGRVSGSIGIESVDRGMTAEGARASIDIVNFDVREALASAERAAARSSTPATAFANELSQQILGPEGLRNRYLDQADAGRGTLDPSAPITSMEQSFILKRGRLSLDPSNGPTDGDPSFKRGPDQ